MSSYNLTDGTSIALYDMGGQGINPKSAKYKAKGDGLQDDTVAIQAAVNDLVTGQTLVMSSGNYSINGNITVATPGVTLDFRKATFTQTGANKRTFILSAVSDVEVIGGRFIGLGTEHAGHGASTSYNNVAAIYMSGDCTNIRISGVKATNHAGGSIRWGLGTMTGLRVQGCRLVGIGSAGGIASGDNNDDVGIGSYTSTADNDIVISGNDISGHCFGIFCARGNGLVISGNDIHDIPGQHGMYISQMSSVNISGNSLRSCNFISMKNQIAGDSLTASDLLIANNQITGGGQAGIDVSVTSVSVGSYFQRVLITGNIITGITSTYGISTDTVREAVVSNNTIVTTAGYGIFYNNSYGSIVGNYVKSANWNPIFGALIHDTDVRANVIVDGVLNAEAGASNNRYKYLIFFTVSADTLIANPTCFLTGNQYRFIVAEPSQYVNTVRLAAGVFGRVRGEDNQTTKGHLNSTASDLKYMDVSGLVTPTYGASIAIDRSLGHVFSVTATNNTAFTVASPTNAAPGPRFTIRLKNTSGGALGVITPGANYKLGAAWPSPATGFSQSLTFEYDGTNSVEVARTAADVAN